MVEKGGKLESEMTKGERGKLFIGLDRMRKKIVFSKWKEGR